MPDYIFHLERSLWWTWFVKDLQVDGDHILADAVFGKYSVGALVGPNRAYKKNYEGHSDAKVP